jgi:hypothetical protein
VVYADPALVKLPFEKSPSTLFGVLWCARRNAFGNSQGEQAWKSGRLLAEVDRQGLSISEEEYWTAGKRSIGLKEFAPVWERTRPPQLKMQREI